MALKNTVHHRGFIFIDAYVRVVLPTITTQNTRLEFAAQVSADPDNLPITTSSHDTEYDLDGPNPLIQAYAYLKTLPEFSEAVDC